MIEKPKPLPSGSLVWVQGLKGPVAEKWPDDAPAGCKAGKVVLATHMLKRGEWSLPVAVLEQRYPAPTVES